MRLRHRVRLFGVAAGEHDRRNACAGDQFSIRKLKCIQHLSDLVRLYKRVGTSHTLAEKHTTTSWPCASVFSAKSLFLHCGCPFVVPCFSSKAHLLCVITANLGAIPTADLVAKADARPPM